LQACSHVEQACLFYQVIDFLYLCTLS